MKWIKITDRLPSYSGKYLVAYPSNSQYTAIAYFEDNERNFHHLSTKDIFKTVTHWMPLPKPPIK